MNLIDISTLQDSGIVYVIVGLLTLVITKGTEIIIQRMKISIDYQGRKKREDREEKKTLDSHLLKEASVQRDYIKDLTEELLALHVEKAKLEVLKNQLEERNKQLGEINLQLGEMLESVKHDLKLLKEAVLEKTEETE